MVSWPNLISSFELTATVHPLCDFYSGRMIADAGGCAAEQTGEMLYKTDRRHGLHHGGEQLAFPALA